MSQQAARFSLDRRASGLLLHPTSLAGPFGSGDLGPAAHKFADFLKHAGQRWWQMLPVGPPSEGNSPYSAQSAFAGSPALVSLDELVRQGLLRRGDIHPPRFSPARVEFPRVRSFRDACLRLAFCRFRKRQGEAFDLFQKFGRESSFWLDDYCLFAAMKNATGGKHWTQWDADVQKRKPAALARVRQALSEEISFQRFVQFQFDRQWHDLRRQCARNGVGLIGDIPIFVAHDSAEVWSHPYLFQLDRHGRPRVVSGCPPDFFNSSGQRWNHPHYNWAAHEKGGFRWWIERFRAALRWFDAVRIDHFLGFHRAWEIPARSRTAKHGHYAPGPGAKFFEVLRDALGDVPIIAEDLGTITQQAMNLRDRFNFPGMRVLQFGFGGGDYHLPHRYPHRCVAYTGTHDNDTTLGWFKSIPRDERRRVLNYVGLDLHSTDGKIVWSLIRLVLSSVADTAIIPVQDLLTLGSDARMNSPGNATGNWAWRLMPGKLTPSVAKRLRSLCMRYARVSESS